MNDLLRQCPEMGCYDIQIDKSTVIQVILSSGGNDIVVGNLSDDIYTSSDFAGYDVRNGNVVNTYMHSVSMYYDLFDTENSDAFWLLRNYDANRNLNDIAIKIFTSNKEYYFYSNGVAVLSFNRDGLVNFKFKNFALGDIGD